MGRSRSAVGRSVARLAFILSLALAPALLGVRPAAAAEDCLLVTDLESGRVLAKQGLCAARHPPNSTFKVVLALMGYDAGILKSDSKPVYEPPPGADLEREVTRGPQTPRSWMKNSVVWYSELLAAELGRERMAQYLKAFAYGNENMGGVKGEAEPGKHYWISSSLIISPREQIDFLRRMLKGELPVSADAVDETIRIMAIDEQPAGWVTFGKTGSGFGRFPDGQIDRSRPFGWFIGFAKKDGRTAVFVRYTSLDMTSPESLGLVARRQTLAALVPVLSAQAP